MHCLSISDRYPLFTFLYIPPLELSFEKGSCDPSMINCLSTTDLVIGLSDKTEVDKILENYKYNKKWIVRYEEEPTLYIKQPIKCPWLDIFMYIDNI